MSGWFLCKCARRTSPRRIIASACFSDYASPSNRWCGRIDCMWWTNFFLCLFIKRYFCCRSLNFSNDLVKKRGSYNKPVKIVSDLLCLHALTRVKVYWTTYTLTHRSTVIVAEVNWKKVFLLLPTHSMMSIFPFSPSFIIVAACERRKLTVPYTKP